jgi:cobalt-zinc-cadmium resistance protein CzcA
MINGIIDFSLRNKLIIGLLTLGMVALGVYNFIKLPIDAVPDITNNQVQVITISPSLAPQEIEQFITFPVEIAMANLQDVTEIRSISRFGLSVVTIVFRDRLDPYRARQMVSEQIKVAESDIPEGYGSPEMMPITTGLGEIFQYVLEVDPAYKDRYDAMELRTIQDWIVKRQLSGIAGIVEVSSFGGYLKQFEVALDPRILVGMDITIAEVFDALEQNNQNTGGSYIEKGPNAYYIRAEGLIEGLDDIRQIVIKTIDNVPIRIGDIAKVGFGSPPRFGAMTRNGEGEAVGGITLMLKGANSAQAIANVKERIEMVSRTLPEGISIHPYLDRSTLISKTIDTVKTNLTEGGLIVIFFLVLLLGSLRSGLIVASVIPLSMLFAFIMMNIFGVTANLMSLGAIDFGLIVDGSVIVVEGIMYSIHSKFRGQYISKEEMDKTVFTASSKVANSATFGVIIILIVYLPILVFTGIEGKTFKPMAQTVSFALIGALILALTYVPVVSSLFLSRKVSDKKNWSDYIIDFFHRAHSPVLELALRRKKLLLGLTIAIVAASFWLFGRMGGEFLPTLEEGDLAAQMTLAPGSSLSESIAAATRAETILMRQFPEVVEVVSKIGTAEVPTDPMAVEDADVMIVMKPKEEWVSADSREELMEKMKEALAVMPGVSFEFTQPIQLRFNELMTGVKSDVAVKIYGEDLDLLFAKANEAAAIIQDIRGAGDVRVEQITGLPQIQIRYKRDKLAQFGLSVREVNKIINTAFAGQASGVVFEGEKRFDLVVRLEETYRRDIRHIERLRVSPPQSELIILSQVAEITFSTGPMQISRDDTKRRITIGINIRNRDVESFVKETDQALAKGIELPPGYYITYGGQFENLQAARQSSSIAVPVALALIFLLLYFAFRSVKQAILIFSAIPLAAVGGILALWIRGMPFSISAGVGFIALFGIAVLNGIVLLAYYNQLEEEGVTDILERVRRGTRLRLRPVMLTASTDALGFLPMALSSAPGAEVQKPLATVVIGGLITATVLTLVVLPALYIMFSGPLNWRRILPKGRKATPIILALLLVGSATQAQQAEGTLQLDLAKVKQMAIERNLQLKDAQLEFEARAKLRRTAADLPPLSVDYQYGQINSGLRDRNLSITQETAFPLTYVHTSRELKQIAEASQSRHNNVAREVGRDAGLAWIEWLYESEALDLLVFEDSLYRIFANAAMIRQENGEISPLERMRAETRTMEVSDALDLQRVALLMATSEVLRLMNLPPSTEVQSTERLASLPLFVPSRVEGQQEHPSIRELQKIEAASLHRLRAERTKLLPGIQVGYFNQTIDKTGNFEGIMAGIRIPLWFSPQQARIQEASLQKEIAGNRLEEAKLSLAFQQNTLAAREAQQRNSLARHTSTSLPQAERMLSDALTAFRLGEINFTDYAQTVSAAFSLRLAYLRNLRDLHQTIILREYSEGK